MAGALGSLCEGGEEEQGGSEGLLEASRAGKGAGTGKKKCGWVKGRLNAMTGKGCGGVGA